MIGNRKWLVCLFFGALAFVAFLFTDHSATAFGALGGTLIGLAGWYHQANVKSKQYKPGDGSDIKP